jgi:hypothetical protein
MNYKLSPNIHIDKFFYNLYDDVSKIYRILKSSGYYIDKISKPEISLDYKNILFEIVEPDYNIKFKFEFDININSKDLVSSFDFSYNFVLNNKRCIGIENTHPEHHSLKKGQAHCHKIGYKKPVKYNKDYISMSDFVLEALTYLKNR